MLVAKGTGATAEAILDLAFAHDVKVREDAALAQLIATADIDCPVPTQALDAVSAVLAHVYAATRRPHPDDADQR
jgi:flagellar biosynthesis protein